jgi:hypothetical protein
VIFVIFGLGVLGCQPTIGPAREERRGGNDLALTFYIESSGQREAVVHFSVENHGAQPVLVDTCFQLLLDLQSVSNGIPSLDIDSRLIGEARIGPPRYVELSPIPPAELRTSARVPRQCFASEIHVEDLDNAWWEKEAEARVTAFGGLLRAADGRWRREDLVMTATSPLPHGKGH